MTEITEQAYKDKIKRLESQLYTETHKLRNEISELTRQLEDKNKEIQKLQNTMEV